MVAKRNRALVRVGQRVRKLRLAAELTQAELADGAGLQPETISRIEAGTQNITLTTMLGISAALGTKPEALLADIDTKPTLRPGEQKVLGLLTGLTDAQLKQVHQALRSLLEIGTI